MHQFTSYVTTTLPVLYEQTQPLAKFAQQRLAASPGMEDCSIWSLEDRFLIQPRDPARTSLLLKQASRVLDSFCRTLTDADVQEGAVKVAVSPTVSALASGFHLKPWNTPLGRLEPRPLTSMLAGAALGGGAGYLGGYAYDKLFGQDENDDRGRRTGALVGAGLGTIPGGLWLASRFAQRPEWQPLTPGVAGRYLLASDEGNAFAKFDDGPAPPYAYKPLPYWRQSINQAKSDANAFDRLLGRPVGGTLDAAGDLYERVSGQLQNIGNRAYDATLGGFYPRHYRPYRPFVTKTSSAFGGDFSVSVDRLGRTLWESDVDPRTAAAALGAAQAASLLSGDPSPRPHDFGMLGIALGAAGGGLQGYTAGRLVGTGLGLLTDMSPQVKQDLARTGMGAGIVSALVNNLF